MTLSRRPLVLVCCLMTVAGAAIGAPPLARLQPRPNLPLLARQVEATSTQLVGLLASGDVRTTYTSHEANLTTSSKSKFEARTTQAETARLLWQVSVMPYPAQTGEAWQTPPGLVDYGMLPAEVVPDGKHAYPFDLSLRHYVDVVRLNQPMIPQGTPPPQWTRTPRPSIFSRWSGSGSARQIRFGWAKPGAGMTAALPKTKKTEKVVTFYIRVVPLDSKGERVGNPSPTVAIRHNVQQSDFKFAATAAAIHPVVRPVYWEPERHQESTAHYWRLIVRRPPLFFGLPGVPQALFTSVAPGQKYSQPIEVYWPPSDKSWWDQVCDAVGSFVSWVADVVSYVSNLYSSIKLVVIDSLSSLAPELRGVLSVALDIGLVAVGIPPSLPDFDDLQNMGADYLCEYIADETGIPAGVTREALRQISEQTKEARHGGSDAGWWMVPDYNKLYRPARVDLRVTNPASSASDRVTVFCTVLADTPQGQRLVAASNPLPLPPLAHNETLAIPIYVQGAPEYAEQVRLCITTQVRYELDEQGMPIAGKLNPYADQYNRRIKARQVWNAAQLEAAPAP